MALNRRHTSIAPKGSKIQIDKECTLDMNARERLEIPNRLMKRYISTNYHYHVLVQTSSTFQDILIKYFQNFLCGAARQNV